MADRATDVLVIGGGAAGVLAAAAASAKGRRVSLVTRSVGASAVSSGAVDLAGDPRATPQNPSSERTDIEGNLLAILQEEPWHPYVQVAAAARDLGDKAKEIRRLFRESLKILEEKGGLALRSDESANKASLTSLGTFKFSAAVQAGAGGFSAQEIENLSACFVGFPGLPGPTAARQARVFDSLRKSGAPVSQWIEVPVPEALGPNAGTIGLATLFDRGDFAAKVAAQVAGALPRGAKLAVLPAVLGIEHAREAAQIFAKALPIPFVESLSAPPSVPGVRLQLALERILEASDVEVIHGELLPEERKGRRAESLRIRTSNGSEEMVSFRVAVLATGKFVGGGLRKEGRIREGIFDLPIAWRGRPLDSAANEEMFNPRYLGAQPAFAAGVRVDARLRPVFEDGSPAFENLHAAGSVLGGFDSVAGPAGLGLALVSGWAAGAHAAEI